MITINVPGEVLLGTKTFFLISKDLELNYILFICEHQFLNCPDREILHGNNEERMVRPLIGMLLKY